VSICPYAVRMCKPLPRDQVLEKTNYRLNTSHARVLLRHGTRIRVPNEDSSRFGSIDYRKIRCATKASGIDHAGGTACAEVVWKFIYTLSTISKQPVERPKQSQSTTKNLDMSSRLMKWRRYIAPLGFSYNAAVDAVAQEATDLD
jgi:hypothetical protein